MPDWTYQTIFKPVLFRFPYKTARGLALGFMGGLGKLPFGSKVIDFFGHMRPAESLAFTWNDITFPTRVGLGSSFDPELIASHALANFGFGFFDVGPICPNDPNAGSVSILIDSVDEVVRSTGQEHVSVSRVAEWIDSFGFEHLPIILRIARGHANDAWPWELTNAHAGRPIFLAWPVEDFLSVDSSERERLSRRHVELVQQLNIPSLLIASREWNDGIAAFVHEFITSRAAHGIIVDGSRQADAREYHYGDASFGPLLNSVAGWRDRLPNDALIVSCGGVHEPAQGISLLRTGADLIEIDSGLVFSGPGLPKRLNETMEALAQRSTPPWNRSRGDHPVISTMESQKPLRPATPMRLSRQGWFWTLLMGVSLFVGGMLALFIANTRVVMPYDEDLCGMTREQIGAFNNRLLDFMCHDRTTLAGTMISLGWIYLFLSWFGGRKGIHWAHASMIWSAFAGFFSFFLFLGFGYFDPLHAFVTAILFQFLLLALHSDLPARRLTGSLDLHNDWQWRLAQWGQLVFIIEGAALVVAGIVIAAIGISTVFVSTDLEFMRTTADTLWTAHPRLVPLIAHDRASFGGMLIASGLAVSLSSLWGFRRGHRWQWWMLMIAGNLAYVVTLIVHFRVGYQSPIHLAPIYAGILLNSIGSVLSFPFLCDRENVESPRSDLGARVASGYTCE